MSGLRMGSFIIKEGINIFTVPPPPQISFGPFPLKLTFNVAQQINKGICKLWQGKVVVLNLAYQQTFLSTGTKVPRTLATHLGSSSSLHKLNQVHSKIIRDEVCGLKAPSMGGQNDVTALSRSITKMPTIIFFYDTVYTYLN